MSHSQSRRGTRCRISGCGTGAAVQLAAGGHLSSLQHMKTWRLFVTNGLKWFQATQSSHEWAYQIMIADLISLELKNDTPLKGE